MNSYFYLFEYPKEIIPKFIIDKKKEKPSKKNSVIYSTFNQLQQKSRIEKKEEDISRLFVALNIVQKLYYQPFTSRLYFHFEDSGILLVNSDNPKNSYYKSFNFQHVPYDITGISNKKKDTSKIQKYKDIYLTIFSQNLYLKYKNTINSLKVKVTYKNNLKTLYQIYDYLEIGGTLCYAQYNIVLEDDIAINTFYLLSLLFKKVLITHYYQRPHYMCFDFLGEKRVSKKQFEWIVEHCNEYTIEPKPSEKEILNTFSFIVSNQNKITKYIINHQIPKFIQKNYQFDLLTIYQFNHTSSFLKIIQQNYIEYFHYKMSDSQFIRMLCSFDKKDIKMISKKIGKNLLKKKDILQIGLSYGSFTSVFHNTFSNPHFTILDPKQESDWDNIGLSLLEEKNVKYDFMESDLMTSFNQLIDEKKKYDFIILLIDETYENLASYFLFINTLLKKDGYLLLNSLSKPYLQLEDYIQDSLTFYHSIISSNNIYLYQKTV